MKVIKRAVLLIDGGHLRAVARNAKLQYNNDFIDGFAKSCPVDDEELVKILYYDCAPYHGEQKLPISGEIKKFENNDAWLDNLGQRDLFAIRRGQLKFRGWSPKRIPIATTELTDQDFKPNFEQKGVDMRLGLDIARLADERLAERLLLISADTDMIPAIKQARKAGIQVVVFQLPTNNPRSQLRNEIKQHADFVRPVGWPQVDGEAVI